jgi:predicted nucleotidyltransferase
MDESREAILRRLGGFLAGKVEFALVFGSILQDRFSAESDVDLALMPRSQWRQGRSSWDLMQDLAAVTDRKVDLILLDESDPIITMQVFANGQAIVVEDGRAMTEFFARKVSEYLDFKRSRQIVENALVSEKPDA